MISIDPDENGWWAHWSELGGLHSCGQWPYPGDPDKQNVVIETQVIVWKFTKRPASIITLAHDAGAMAAEFGGPRSPRVKWVQPRSWKGNTRKPKSANQWSSYAIHRLVIEALSPREIAIYTAVLAQYPEGERHNLADAVGIGLWELGRLPQPRTESPRRAARMAALAETLRRQAS